MTVCLVTDRRRLCGEDASFAVAAACVVEQARAAVAAGVDLIQVRERDLEARQLMTLVEDIVGVSRGTPTRVLVNDRLDVALACGADGVHLRSDSVAAAQVRRVTPPSFLVGRSVHSAAEAMAAGPVDYVVAGTVFATTSKPVEYPLIGVDGLRAITSVAPAPVLAIGGIILDRMDLVAGAGAEGVAAIGLFAGRAPIGPIVAAIRARFDRVKSAS